MERLPQVGDPYLAHPDRPCVPVLEMSTLLHDVTLLQALGPFIPAEHQVCMTVRLLQSICCVLT